jgi:hypothetical protein
LNNIKKSAVSRGENISKRTGQKSSKYGEIIKKPYFCVWGKGRQMASQATPHPTASRSAEFTRGKNAIPGRGFGTRTEGEGGGKTTQNLITHQRNNISMPYFT